MIQLFKSDEWRIIEEGFNRQNNRFTESIFSLGNGHMGLRGFFEEGYSGDSLPGTYMAGIYYPDKTRVGWWKNGYPEFFAKVLNATNWIGVKIRINGEPLDLAKNQIRDFYRELDLKQGRLLRSFVLMGPGGQETRFEFTRFLSMAREQVAVINLRIKPLNHEAEISLTPYLDGGVVNQDANYDEVFWEVKAKEISPAAAWLTMETKKTGFWLTTAFASQLVGEEVVSKRPEETSVTEKFLGYHYSLKVAAGQEVNLEKIVVACTSRDFEAEELAAVTLKKLTEAQQQGGPRLFAEHQQAMAKLWESSDIIISGDVEAQQALRYNIFQLNQTYSGRDPRLNIGPKGFTGEKYGGSTYWDTEAFCFPFYLYTKPEVAKNLLYYRYLHLERAKENAAKLGLKGALYPMVTMDGQECHNEWEITFEEIHRNGAIAYAIYNYTNYTGDTSYLKEYGIEVLVELSRFWESRVSYNPRKGKYMILGVTGPNEYENNVNNNWYTNLMAAWTLEYTLASIKSITTDDPQRYQELQSKLKFTEKELAKWQDINQRIYYPYVSELEVFEQQDLFMDKELQPVTELAAEDLPLNKHWSWDRILRSCFIKQADVLQGIYFFPERFSPKEVTRNFDFYEPMTVHESSLSPSIYSIVASRIGYHEKAYELYLRTARLDLDNYNDDTDDGIHLTSMAGTWAAIVQGFAGVLVREETLHLDPYLPPNWKELCFQFVFRGRHLKVAINHDEVAIEQLSGAALELVVWNKKRQVSTASKAHFTRGN